MAAPPQDNLPPDAAATLLHEADRLFDAGNREAAAPLYAHLAEFGPPNARVAARHAEALLQEGSAFEALAYLRGAEQHIDLDAWGRRALAYAESGAGDGGAALSLAAAALLARPDDPGFVTTFLDMQQRHGAPASWREALGHVLPASARRELELRLALAEGRLSEAAVMLEEAGFAARDRVFYLAVQTAYAALEADDAALARVMAGRVEQAGPDDVATILLRTELALHQQHYDEAAAALGKVPAARAGDAEVRQKWFEHACFTGDAARARHLLAEMDGAGPLPRQAVPAVLRFLAEQQDWDGVLDRARAWLGADFRFRQIGYVLFRAARRTARAADLLAGIEAVAGWRDNPDLARLHTALAWDGAASAGEMAQVARQAQPSPAMRHRMAVQRRVMARAGGDRHAVFLCSDAAFLSATCVALHSALQHGGPADFFLVVPDVLAEMAERLANAFRDAGHCLVVVRASAVVPDHIILAPAYGVFTSGLALSAAAYYRIYFARHLLQLGRYKRALYLDGDVLVRRSLDPLFGAALDGHPLSARVEPPRPEVARATALHGLRDGAYFNSGVLLFDLTHPSLGEALDRSIAAATDDRVPKLFHDQCALNLAFRDLFQPLPETWNTAVAEHTSQADLPDDAAILHFLERPKPWSAAYDGACGPAWLDRWERTADIIGPQMAVTLLKLTGE